MFETKLEFPEGWGERGYRANPFHGGYGYFLEPHNLRFWLFNEYKVLA